MGNIASRKRYSSNAPGLRTSQSMTWRYSMRCWPRPRSRGRVSIFLAPCQTSRVLGPDVNINLFADQAAGQRVGVAADVDRAPGIDPGLEPSSHLQPASRQG